MVSTENTPVSVMKMARLLTLLVAGSLAGSAAIAQIPPPPGLAPPAPGSIPAAPDFGRGPGPGGPGFPGRPFAPPGGFPDGGPFGPPPPFLAGLHLSEDQDDKVFAIFYKAAPAIREQSKALRQARETLGKLGNSAQFDERRARELADAAAKAESELALLRARTEHEIYLLLTPQQREQLEKAKDRPPQPPPPRG